MMAMGMERDSPRDSMKKLSELGDWLHLTGKEEESKFTVGKDQKRWDESAFSSAQYFNIMSCT